MCIRSAGMFAGNSASTSCARGAVSFTRIRCGPGDGAEAVGCPCAMPAITMTIRAKIRRGTVPRAGLLWLLKMEDRYPEYTSRNTEGMLTPLYKAAVVEFYR